MKVQEAMSATVFSVSPGDDLQKVARLMRDEDIGLVPVVEGDRVLGLITDRDMVVRCMAEGHEGMLQEKVEHCMTRAPATIDVEADLSEAASLMERHEVRRLPVVENGKLVGVLSHGNLVQATGADGPGDRATLGVTKDS